MQPDVPSAVATHVVGRWKGDTLVTGTTPDRPNPAHLAYLDGMRGLAALYVVAFHAYCSGPWSGMPTAIRYATRWLGCGHGAVAVFIVLSGYCLALPVAADPHLRLRGGVWGFVKRRGRRILPPYYAAVALSLALIWLIPAVGRPRGAYWDMALPAFRPGPVLSHLLLIHNVSPNWSAKIDYPLWTVATEWQIYFVFAIVLLPLWRRWGIAAALAFTACGLLPHFLRHVDQGKPHYLVLFGMGMCAALISQQVAKHVLLTVARPAAVVGCVAVAALMEAAPDAFLWHVLPVDMLVGATTGAVLIHLTRCTVCMPRHPALRLLCSLPAQSLGAMSYSLYLFHAPWVALVAWASQRALPRAAQGPVTLVFGVVVAVTASYAFYLAFERPFLRKPTARQAAPAERPPAEATVGTGIAL